MPFLRFVVTAPAALIAAFVVARLIFQQETPGIPDSAPPGTGSVIDALIEISPFLYAFVAVLAYALWYQTKRLAEREQRIAGLEGRLDNEARNLQKAVGSERDKWQAILADREKQFVKQQDAYEKRLSDRDEYIRESDRKNVEALVEVARGLENVVDNSATFHTTPPRWFSTFQERVETLVADLRDFIDRTDRERGSSRRTGTD